MRKLALCLALSFPIISFLMEEFYPYSSVSMFSFTVNEVYKIEVYNQFGEQVNSRFQGVDIANCCDPKVSTWGRLGYGAQPEPSFLSTASREPYGIKPDLEEIKPHLLLKMNPREQLSLNLTKTFVENHKVVTKIINTLELKK